MGENADQFNRLKTKFSRFVDDVRMSDIVREVSSLQSKAHNMQDEVKKVRSRGYAFRSYLENKAQVIERRWDEMKHQVERIIQQESDDLRDEFKEAETLISQGEKLVSNETAIARHLPRFESLVTTLETKIGAAQKRVRGIYADLSSDVSQMTSQINEINWFCDRKDEASFQFLAGEAMFLAAKAEWDDGKDKPEGFIFLTDQRLVFEQKEKVGKTLGMFGGKEVHEKRWEVPLSQIEKVEAENKGLFGGKDMLYFTLGGGAPYGSITVEVKGGVDCKFWMKQIQRMMAGETKDERAIAPDPELIEKLREAPTECHVCGGKLPIIMAGQNQISCEYCGSTVRI